MRRRQLLGTAAAFLAGCTGGRGSDTPTATPTPIPREFPYTAASPGANVNPRSLSVNNRTARDHQATVRLTDIETGRTVLERTVPVDGESEHTFEDVIGKVGTYRIRFELAVGVSKRYEWPIDESHGDAGITIAKGETPTQPVVWFSITDL